MDEGIKREERYQSGYYKVGVLGVLGTLVANVLMRLAGCKPVSLYAYNGCKKLWKLPPYLYHGKGPTQLNQDYWSVCFTLLLLLSFLHCFSFLDVTPITIILLQYAPAILL